MNRRIIAVAYNTFRNYFFTPMSIAIVIILLLIPFLCSNMPGDGTAEGKFKVFVTYSFIISCIIFTVTNISISCSAISSEWKKKTLLTLDVKPIKRWEIIVGKWSGMLAMNIVFIICFLLSMTFSSILVSRNLTSNFPEHKNIFITETELFPVLTDELSQNKSSGFMSFLQIGATSKSKKGDYSVPARESMEWTFKGIRQPTGNLYLSYRFQVWGPEGQSIAGYWLAGNPSLSAPFELETNLLKDRIHRLLISGQAVSNKGELTVTYKNIEPTNISVLFPASDFKILYSQGNYWINLIKGVINILILVTFIYSVGLCFSCIVSNLTAILSTSILIFISYLHEFLDIMLNYIFAEIRANQPVEIVQRISYPVLKFISFILPPLNEALPHSYIGSSILIPSSYLAFLFTRIILLGALPLLIVAVIYLSYRELGIPNE